MSKRAKRTSRPASKPLTINPRTPGVFGAAIYCRVSTAHQSTDSQLLRLREYCSARGWDVLVEVSDVASGASDRPQREALLAAARRREIDGIVVYKLDRWGRSTLDLVSTLTELHEAGLPLVSVTDALDMTTSAGKALAGMLAVFAGFERDLIRERVNAGLDAARERGVTLGRPATAQTHAPEVRELRAQGLSERAISKRVGISPASVHRILAA